MVPMNIHQFEKSVSKVILSRGKNYFKDGAIHSFEQIAVNAWRAKVIGTDDYFVYVELNGDTITESVCTCPFNGTCKHEIAMYFTIRKEINALNALKENNFTPFFQDKTKEELLVIISDILHENPLLLKKWLPQQNKQSKILTIDEAEIRILRRLNPFIRKQYLDESQVGTAFEGLYEVLDEIETIVNENPLHALDLVLHCVETLWPIEDYCEMWIYDMITEAMYATFDVVIESIDTKEDAIKLTQHLLSKFNLYALMNKPNVFLFEGAVAISKLADSKDYLLETLHKRYETSNNPDLLKLLELHVVKEVGTEEELEAYYTMSSLPEEVRTEVIQAAVERNKLDEALSLCADGIESAETSKDYKNQWLFTAFNIHGILGNPIAQRTIAFELMANGRMEEYQMMKDIYQKDVTAWQEIMDELFLVFEEQEERPYHYVYILEAEGRFEKLLSYCEENKQRILRFGQALQPHFPTEVETLHTLLLLETAEVANNRETYRTLAVILSRMRDIGYDERAEELKVHLIKSYPRKKAMHEELNGYIFY